MRYLLLAVIFLVACGHASKTTDAAQPSDESGVLVFPGEHPGDGVVTVGKDAVLENVVVNGKVANQNAPSRLDRIKAQRAKIPTERHALLPDPRTPEQLARAACSVAGGGWACPAVKRPMRASSVQPVLPLSWSVPAWYVDASNATGCASDANTGTSATCSAGGAGPLLTPRELLVHRWGCQGSEECPRLLQDTVITFLSNSLALDQPFRFTPGVENGTYTVVDCPLGTAQKVGAGTLGTVTAKNRATNQALESTFTATSGTIAPYQLLENTTHPSFAWVNRAVSATWLITQPMLPITPPVTYTLFPYDGDVVEVDTWTAGDAYVAYVPTAIFAPKIEAANVNMDVNVSSGIYVHNCDLSLPNSPATTNYGQGQAILGDFVFLVESETTTSSVIFASHTFTAWNASYDTLFAGSTNFITTFENAGALSTSNNDAGEIPILGGALLGGTSGTGLGMFFDLDFQFSGGEFGGGVNEFDLSSGSEANLGVVYIDSNAIVIGFTPGGLYVDTELGGIAALYGPGAVATAGIGAIQYPSGAGSATSTFLLAGGIKIGNSTTACSHSNASPDVLSCGITLTPAHLDAAQGVAGFGGNAFLPIGGSVVNF